MAGAIALLMAFVPAAVALNLNPDLKFVPVNPALEGKSAVVRIYKAGEQEVHLKSLPIADKATAERAVEVSYGLVKGLYQPKKNPYAGEVTALVQCDKKFAPKEFSISCGGRNTKAIVGGAGERHAFGMCTENDIKEIGAFFSCYDESKQEMVEVRVFIPFAKGRGWSEQIKRAEKLAAGLLR